MDLELEAEQAEQRAAFFNCVESYYGGGSIHFSKPEMRLTAEYRQQIKGIFCNEPCLYNHRIYEHATVIYNAMRNLLSGVKQEQSTARRRKKKEEQTVERRNSYEVPKNVFSSANEKRLSFSLVFQTLKYQKFLQEMLTNSKFFEAYPKLEDHFSCVMVILCDYQTRKFQRRLQPPGDHILIPQMAEIEDALDKCRTKLHAALARSRISARVQSLDSLLPDVVRNNDRIGSYMNIACWINNLRSSFQAMEEELSKEGFSLVQTENELRGKSFLVDRHCPDVIFFPHHLIDYLEALPIVKKKALVIQDKSSSIGVHSIRCLISDGDDVIHVNVGAGMTSAHLVSLSQNISGSSVFAFGINTENQLKQVVRNIDKFGAKGRVRVMSEKFLDVDLNDPRLKDIKVILITANCSRCGVPNPVNFIVSEGEDYDFTSYASILRDLSFGHVDSEKVSELISKNMATLKHALQFPRVQTVVFCTRSMNEWENELVVNASIDYINTIEQTKTPFRLSPPLLPLTDLEIETENPLCGKFLKFPPTQLTSGCFLATISREADDPKEAAKDILARAAARGIISGLPTVVENTPLKAKAKPLKERAAAVAHVKGVKQSRGPSHLSVPDPPPTTPS